MLSSRGAIRGYTLARQRKEIKLREIILAIEGSDVFDRCIFWSQRCVESDPCPMHFRWKRLKKEIMGQLMERTTLADLVKRTVA